MACWNADGVRGRKLELDHFLGQYVIDIYLLTESPLLSGEAFRMATDRLAEGAGTAILVPMAWITTLYMSKVYSTMEATVIQSCRPVNRLKSWRFTSRPSGLYVLRTCLPALAAVFPSSWQVK